MTDARLAAAVEAAAREAMRAEGDPNHWRYEQAPEDVAAWWRGWVTPHVTAALAAADAFTAAAIEAERLAESGGTPGPRDPDEPREPRPVPR